MERLRAQVVAIAKSKPLSWKEMRRSSETYTLRPVLWIISHIYRLAFKLDRARKLARAKTLNSFVIGVGNVTWGGTGKTPMVQYLSEMLLRNQVTPIVLSRGYGNDESKLLRYNLESKGAKVGVGIDRIGIGAELLKQCDAKRRAIILDDAFQMHALQRDVDIVMVNALEGFGNGHLLPYGTLREPPSGLNRAHICVIHHANLIQHNLKRDLKIQVAQHNPIIPIFESAVKPTHFLRLRDELVLPVQEARGKQAVLFSGIACGESFSRLAQNLGFRILKKYEFVDHHHFSKEELATISREFPSKDEIFVTTEKDFHRARENMLCSFYDREVWILVTTLELLGADQQARFEDLLLFSPEVRTKIGVT
eukprot:TRINITY_DN8334_c0_g1_i1.p1 TRINITY_DN8334_c0_g1~~TRINITY_DN8334_c0_g1_i1.p1  ORF type:complete len:366 (+),score=47.98 TRINITY_DN8334_c0_g1_i1:77-1174(+)